MSMVGERGDSAYSARSRLVTSPHQDQVALAKLRKAPSSHRRSGRRDGRETTAELIPLCHPFRYQSGVSIEIDDQCTDSCQAKSNEGRTGRRDGGAHAVSVKPDVVDMLSNDRKLSSAVSRSPQDGEVGRWAEAET